MGDSDWLAEVQDPRTSDGPLIRYRARVRRKTAGPSTMLPLVFYVSKLLRDGRHVESVELVLYNESARPGDDLLVVVPVPVDAPVEAVERTGFVSAWGTPEPGHGLILNLDGNVVHAAGPAWRPTIFAKRMRL